MRVNEIFYSLQGEGRYTGTPAVFVRLSGCNMRCWFCDTDFSAYQEMSEEQIVDEVLRYPCVHVVITGGEPTIQLTPSLVDLLHQHGRYVMMETNGTLPLAEGCNIDWITCSPKLDEQNNGSRRVKTIRIQRIDELKVVYEGEGKQDMSLYEAYEAKEYRLQPCDVKDPKRNQQILEQTIDYILHHPKWKLSLQTHKIINVR